VNALVATGIETLDEQLGGLPAGSLVQVYGPAGSGKSSLALTMARELAPCALVLAERLHRQRVADVLGSTASRILVARPGSMAEQNEAVAKGIELVETEGVGGLVLDSLTFLYRFEQLSSTEALSAVFEQVGGIHSAVRDGQGLAVVTNQVRGTGDDVEPIGGPGVKHASDVILRLSTIEGGWRRLTLDKHPFEAPGRSWEVKITRDGVR
jgi:recombination protein RecA